MKTIAKRSGRRRFLKDGATLAGLAVAGTIRSASGQVQGPETSGVHPKDTRAYGERSRFEKSARIVYPPTTNNTLTPLQDSIGIITPSSLHMMRNHGGGVPDIDPREHRLLIHGIVDRPLIFTMEELKRMPSVSRIHFIQCAGVGYLDVHERQRVKTAQDAYGKTSCSEWTGVLLSVLLKEVGVQKGGTWIVTEGVETSRVESIPMVKAMDDVILAYGQNGEALRPEQGYPLRLVVPGWEGTRNQKWLKRIQIGEQPFMTLPETSRYVNHVPDKKARWFQFELEPISLITFPSGEQRLPGRGFYEITGLAWSGGGTVRRVEVSTDGGKTWKDAQLQEPVLRFAHTRFRFPWNWDGQEAVLQSRCTDERGDVQPSLAELSENWGVKPDYWLSTKVYGIIQHFNAIQPWKVTRDGSVHNAMFEI